MSDFTAKHLLLDFKDILTGWAEGVRHESFWRDGNEVDYLNYVEEIRQSAKEYIIWMELKGLGEEAIRLDVTMQSFRQAAWEYKHYSNGSVYSPEDDYCHQLREEMAQKAEEVAGCVEDLNDEIDSSIWEEYINA